MIATDVLKWMYENIMLFLFVFYVPKVKGDELDNKINVCAAMNSFGENIAQTIPMWNM